MEKTTQTHAAEKKLKEILDQIFYSTTSLTHLLVKAHRSGMAAHGGAQAHEHLREAVRLSLAAYTAAIAQPENKVATRPEVNL